MPLHLPSQAGFQAGAGLSVHAAAGLGAAEVFSRPLHLAVGMFDGVHIGHQALIRQAKAAAAIPGHSCGVLTFEPHPSRILYPERATPLLMPLEQRIRRMQEVGADFVLVQTFTSAYARQRADEFVPGLVRALPSLMSLHVGGNFRYGAGRSGNVDTLRATAAACGVELHALQRELLDGTPVSSSRIRLALVEGAIDEVNAMLGSPYVVEGPVVAGKGVGRRIEFPTLNISWRPEVLPRFGVYQVLLQHGGHAPVPGVANYGLRPTLGQAEDPLLEVHLLEPEILPPAGATVRVAMLQFIRPERSFPSVEELRQQIARDVASVRRSLGGEGNPARPLL